MKHVITKNPNPNLYLLSSCTYCTAFCCGIIAVSPATKHIMPAIYRFEWDRITCLKCVIQA